ncbi:hypothetical protein [Pseudomonas monteilii]|uniref:hypothetical protein n=1 Tax=Pseudomonas monteilii TaxID=76759 RepID=UPI0018AC08F0|nr:hypothetical protein [Pseudomonas monteilii]MBF8744993.1 hypothetical protein [Pseudomonas monteilii]
MLLWDIAHFYPHANSQPFIWIFRMESLRWKQLETWLSWDSGLGIDPTDNRALMPEQAQFTV